jgi:hypothetical protein
VTEAEALEAARRYADEHGVPWVEVALVQKTRAWYFKVLAYHFDIDTGGQGVAWATVNTQLGVVWFEFRPTDPDRFWLPPWAAYPLYNSVTTGWRQGNGEQYWIDWHDWYAALPQDRKAAYRERFPEPDRDGWPGFYELAWRRTRSYAADNPNRSE